jgi:hypothetical protein
MYNYAVIISKKMQTSFVSTTQVQRSAKTVFSKNDPYQIVLNNNQMVGVILNKEMATILLNEGILDEIYEERLLMNEKETQVVLAKAKDMSGDEISLTDFRTKHDV